MPEPTHHSRLTPANALRELGFGFLDILFPPRCLTCGALAEPFCGACRGEIRPARHTELPAGLAGLRSAGLHEGPLREAVLKLKFDRKTALIAPLAGLLAEELQDAAAWRADVLAPVPIHWTRCLERGFNQSELLALRAGRETGQAVLHALRKTRRTPPQVGLTASQRSRNLRGAFAVDPAVPVAGKRLVLIDDVTTTGATLEACARALHRAGAAAVYAVTLTCDAVTFASDHRR